MCRQIRQFSAIFMVLARNTGSNDLTGLRKSPITIQSVEWCKTMIMKQAIFLLALLAASAQAEIYKSVNENGEVIFSDVPSKGAERMQVPEIPTYTPVPIPVATPGPAMAETSASESYKTLAISRPGDNETIRSNAGILNVAVSLKPELQTGIGHRVQFFMDGEPYGKPLARLSTSFTNVDRGTHSIAAAVIDENGDTLIKAAPVEFHLLRASLLQPANPLHKPANGNSSGSSSGTTGTGGSTGTAAPASSGSGVLTRSNGM
jgi:hypothetical protein